MFRELNLLAALLFVGVSAVAGAEAELPVYPGTVHTRIGNDLVIGGRYYRLAYFQTDDAIEKVAAYFVREWEGQGYPTYIDGEVEHGELIVSAVYTREGLMRTVILRRHQGRTVGFTSLRDLWLREDAPDRPGLVTLEGTLYSSDVRFEDGGGSAQNRSQMLKGTFGKVYADVRARLAKQGLSLGRETGSEHEGRKQVILEAAGKGIQLMTVLTDLGDETVALSQTWVGTADGALGPAEAKPEKQPQQQPERRR